MTDKKQKKESKLTKRQKAILANLKKSRGVTIIKEGAVAYVNGDGSLSSCMYQANEVEKLVALGVAHKRKLSGSLDMEIIAAD